MSFPTVIFSDAASKAHLVDQDSAQWKLGQRLFYDDGRRFSYALVGGTATVAGDTIQGKALVSGDYTDVVTAISAVGDTTVSITSTTTTAANYYDGGWLHINKGTGAGHMYRVKASGSHAVFTSGAGDIVTLDENDAIRVALAATDECGLVPDEWNGVIVAPVTTLTSRVVGVACQVITAAQYGFIQTWGAVAVDSVTTSVVVGNEATAILASAGRVGINDGAGIDENVGIFMSVPTTAGEYASLFVKID